MLGGKYVGLGAGGSETFLADGGRIEFTQSAIVLESLVNKFFANFADKGGPTPTPATTPETSPEENP